jgi:hypothetical protein
MARPEKLELLTAWFTGVLAKAAFLLNQKVRRPALTKFARKSRLEPMNSV